jgi:hypothetical protein
VPPLQRLGALLARMDRGRANFALTAFYEVWPNGFYEVRACS